MDAAQFLPTEPSPEVTQIHDGDYKDADGLWHCGVCGKARQKKINSPYFHKTVWCICDCRATNGGAEKERGIRGRNASCPETKRCFYDGK